MSTTEGTWCFWAPEMCGTRQDGAAFNAYAADSWAAGVTLWCFLYGRVPFFGFVPVFRASCFVLSLLFAPVLNLFIWCRTAVFAVYTAAAVTVVAAVVVVVIVTVVVIIVVVTRGPLSISLLCTICFLKLLLVLCLFFMVWRVSVECTVTEPKQQYNDHGKTRYCYLAPWSLTPLALPLPPLLSSFPLARWTDTSVLPD